MNSDLTDDDIARIWHDRVRRDVFSGHSPANGTPLLLLVGGQPGAGKTAGMSTASRMHPDHDLVPIIGDDLRVHHPRYLDLLRSDDRQMPAVTAAASAAWIRMSLQHGREHGYSCLVEGTFRSPATTLDTAVTFASAGYEVHVVALAVPAAVSRLGTLLRYYGAIAAGQSGRWTDPAAHDAGYQGTPRSLQALQEDPHVHRITIMNRGGATIYDTLTQPRTGAVGALTAERERTWTPQRPRLPSRTSTG